MGRPSALETDPGLTERIAGRVRGGAHPFSAAGAEGVPERTFSRWMARGESEAEQEDETPYARLWLAVTRARSEAVASSEAELHDPLPCGEDGRADNTRVNAKHKWLAANEPERWGQKIDVRVRSEAVEHVLDRLRTGLDPATYERVLECLAHGEGPGTAGEDAQERLH